MTLGPILPGRIPNSLVASRLQAFIDRETRTLNQLQDQVASGQKFFLPSESPHDAISTIVLQKLLKRQEHLQHNLRTDRSLLSASESALTSVSQALNQAKSFVLAANDDSTGLGIAGQEPSGSSFNPLVGTDVNARQSAGGLTILSSLETALRNGDNRELERLSQLIDAESDHFNQVRGELGTRLQLVDDVENRLQDQDLQIQESLSEHFDTDISEVLTQFLAKQQSLQATLQIAADTLRLSLLNFL